MIVSNAPGSIDARSSMASANHTPRIYSMYGLRVGSSIRLPAPVIERTDQAEPEWVFVHAGSAATAPEPDGPEVARLHCEHGRVIATRHQGAGGEWIQVPGAGTFHVRDGARRVDVYPLDQVDEQLIGLALCGLVPIFILLRSGRPCLHAGAVVTSNGAIAFLGPKGQGKSTMVGVFLRQGAALLTDDALPLEPIGGEICGVPSLPLMKVWDETADQVLGLAHELPHLEQYHPKRLFALAGNFAHAPSAVPLRAFYVLARRRAGETGAISIERVGGRGALSALIGQTAARELVLPGEMARYLPLYARLVTQAPVYVVRYPSGLEHHQAVYERILANREGR